MRTVTALDTSPPNERVRQAIERAEARRYHESRRDEAAATICNFARVTGDLLGRFEYGSLSSVIDKFNRETMMLEIRAVPPPPTERELWESKLATARYSQGLPSEERNIGYSGDERDSLWRLLRPGEKIVTFDVWQVETTTRSISRRELRLGTAARFQVMLPDWNEEQYLKRFPELPPRDARTV